MPLSLSQTKRRIALAVGTFAGTLAFATPAMASTTTPDSVTSLVNSIVSRVFAGQTAVSECAAPAMSLPFLGFGDERSYVLAPNGGFSNASGGGWQFLGGSRIVSATRPLVGPGGVLNLPAGAAALSPVMCVDLDYPTARAWTGGTGSLDISVTYPDDRTGVGLVPKSVVAISGLDRGTWKLSSDFDVKPQNGGALAGWRRVSFLLTNTSKSSVQMDDLYVDPRMR